MPASPGTEFDAGPHVPAPPALPLLAAGVHPLRVAGADRRLLRWPAPHRGAGAEPPPRRPGPRLGFDVGVLVTSLTPDQSTPRLGAGNFFSCVMEASPEFYMFCMISFLPVPQMPF